MRVIIAKYIVLSFILLAYSIKGIGKNANEKSTIFYLNSYDITFHTFESSQKAITEVFPLTEYVIDADFLDSKRFNQSVITENLKERLKIKLAIRGKYDIVLASDDNALQFVLDNYQEFFANTPVVFWGYDNIKKARLLDSADYVTGVVESVLIQETIRLIQCAQKDVNEIIALTDDTNTGLIDFEIYESLKANFPGLKLSEIHTEDFTVKELQDTISRLDNNKAILKLSAYRLKDANLNLFEQNELFYENSPVPIYCLGYPELKLGLMGGCFSDYFEHAKLACQMAKRILNGEPVAGIEVVFDFPGVEMINYQTMQKYGIAADSLPANTILHGAPSTKFHIRKELFLFILFSLFVVLVFLGVNIRLLTLKRKLTQRLSVSQQNYETLFRESPSVNLLIDPATGQIADANNSALQFYGYHIDEIKGLNINDINTHPITDVHKKMEQAQRGSARSTLFSHRKKNGEIRDVDVFTGKLTLNDQSFLHTIVVDITERLETERRIIEAKQKAEESDNLKSSFLANMSHEIRTPMNSILGFSDLLINEKVDPKKQLDFLKMIYANGNHLLNLINDIIDISKIEANQLKIIPRETPINVLLDELYMEFDNRRISENLEFTMELIKGSKNPDFEIISDGVRIKQILINLLGNAFKFTEKGHVQFGYKVRDDGMLQFFVKDTGIGIPKDKHEFVFAVFQRLEDSYTKNYIGAGLGLSITKSLVEKLGGHIWLMSEEGQGSRFYFTIPGAAEKLRI